MRQTGIKSILFLSSITSSPFSFPLAKGHSPIHVLLLSQQPSTNEINMQRRRESIQRATIINPKPLEYVRIVSLDYFLIGKKKNPSSNSKQKKWEKQKGRKQKSSPTLWTLKSLGTNNSNNHRQHELTRPVNQDSSNGKLNRPMFFSLLRSKFSHTHKNQTPRNEKETKKGKCTWMEELEGVQNPTRKPPNAKWKTL